MDRRNFLKTGGLAMLGTLAVPSFGVSAIRQSLAGADNKAGTAAAMTHFGVAEADLKKVLAAALEKGGDYADLYFEHTFNNSVSLMDGKVNNCSSNIDFGMGVRVVAGDQTGYAYVENITLDEMLRAARTAARIADDKNHSHQAAALTEVAIPAKYYDEQAPWETFTVKDKIPYLQKLNDRIFALDERVHKVRAFLSDSTSHIFFCNSEGQMYYDYRPMCSLAAICIMEKDGRVENAYASRSYRMGTDFLNDALIETLAKEAVDKTSILFQAVKPKGGEMPVVMGAGGSGILLHEAIGHGFGLLGDEYTQYIYAIDEEGKASLRASQALGRDLNLDITNDETQILWNKFLADDRYADENLGIYEGGWAFYSYGVYRPSFNSIMRYNEPAFNAPSREAIYKRAMRLAYGDSWTYDYEDFVEFDAPSRNTAASRSLRQAPSAAQIEKWRKNHRPPVRVKGTWRDAKKNHIVVPYR